MAINSWLTVEEECFMQEPHSCPIKLIIQQVEKWIFFKIYLI